ncbi:DegT/DnrJ/EryC1/StrS family aminotransferase [bacterium]|nr:DegT/DnrJ/EryC1/StrS family aminotransferase [bacterium]MBU1676670.1 DegT/DnrJ/EryC1/StrS family aminotransferase [bacterium]
MNESTMSIDVWRPSSSAFPFIKGRVAFYAILRAAGIGPGDEVVVPGFTCVVVAAAIQYTGARPVYYDIILDTLNGNPGLAEERITERTRAVIVQHTFGMPMDLGGLPDICRDRGILLIEDCAHAMGATVHHRPVGTLGDASFASFQWSKPVTTGLGGVALVNEPRLRDSMIELYNHEFQEPSFVKSMYLALLSTTYNRFFRPSIYWMARDTYRRLVKLKIVQGSSSMDELLSPDMPPNYKERFGHQRRRQIDMALDGLPDVIVHRRRIAQQYANWFSARGAMIQSGPEGANPVWLRFPVLVENRTALLNEARRRRIELGDWFNSPLHPSVSDPAMFGYRSGLCPVADYVSSGIVNLPTHQRVAEADLRRILGFFDEYRYDIVRQEETV